MNYIRANHFQYILIFLSKSSLQREEEHYGNPRSAPRGYLKAVRVDRMGGESSVHRTANGRCRAKDQGRIWERHILPSGTQPQPPVKDI